MKYEVQWYYRSGAGGPWEKGEVVDLEPDAAEHINRDSPNVLVEVKARQVKKRKNRQAKPAQDRAAGPVMSTKDSGLVKD